MKLLSFIGANGPTWGAVVGQDDVIDLGKEMPQHANLAAYIGSGDYLKAQDHVVGKKPSAKLGAITFLPVIPEPEKIVCAVRNYMDHHQEVLAAGMHRELSEEPPIFLRVWRSQVAHNQPIICPNVYEDILEKSEILTPHFIIIDLIEDYSHGLSLIEKIRKRFIGIQIIAVTLSEDKNILIGATHRYSLIP